MIDIEKVLADIHRDMVNYDERPDLDRALGDLALAYASAYCAQVGWQRVMVGAKKGAADAGR